MNQVDLTNQQNAAGNNPYVQTNQGNANANTAVANTQQNQPATIKASEASGITEVSLTDDIKLNQLDRFPKMAANQIARISFLLFKNGSEPLLKLVSSFYDKSNNKFYLTPDNKELATQMQDKIGQAPQPTFHTIILKYITDHRGQLMQDQQSPTGFAYELLAYRFGADKFPIFKAIHQNWGLQTRDLVITCTEASYQKLDIQPAPEHVIAKTPEVFQQVINDAQMHFNSTLDKMIGVRLSDDELRKELGLLAPGMAPIQSNPGMVSSPFVNQNTPGQPANNVQNVPPNNQGIQENVGTEGAVHNFSDLLATETQQPANTEMIPQNNPPANTNPNVNQQVDAQGNVIQQNTNAVVVEAQTTPQLYNQLGQQVDAQGNVIQD